MSARHLPDPTVRGKARIITAEFTGIDTCTGAGITAHGSAAALTFCREAIAAGLDPDRALEVYRNGVLALRIRSIAEGAALTVAESDGPPRFRRYRPYPSEHRRTAGSPIIMRARPLHPVTVSPSIVPDELGAGGHSPAPAHTSEAAGDDRGGEGAG